MQHFLTGASYFPAPFPALPVPVHTVPLLNDMPEIVFRPRGILHTGEGFTLDVPDKFITFHRAITPFFAPQKIFFEICEKEFPFTPCF